MATNNRVETRMRLKTDYKVASVIERKKDVAHRRGFQGAGDPSGSPHLFDDMPSWSVVVIWWHYYSCMPPSGVQGSSLYKPTFVALFKLEP
jgi:hypothetical protein